MPRFRSLAPLVAGLGLFLAPLPTADAFGPLPDVVHNSVESSLLAELSGYASLTDGTVGIALRDLQSGETLGINLDTLFPMASTYKVAVAGKILSLADAGSLSLDERLTRFGTALPVTSLLDLMLTHSDNAATDLLVERAGGPAAVNGWLQSIGIRGQRVDSNTADLLKRAKEMRAAPGEESVVDAGLSAQQRDARDWPNIAFAHDIRDSSTPRAMNDLLAAIHEGKALKPASTALLLDIMARCHTGKKRLRALLPLGTPIAHKTGTLNGLGNDAGIITLPDGRSFAISVFVMKDHQGHVARDFIMAQAARTAYAYFLAAPERRAS